jgi:hypothetical protein
MDEDLALACDGYRAAEVKETALVVIQDKDLQRILSVWPLVGRRVFAQPLDVAPGDWTGLWDCVDVDLKGLEAVAGLPVGRGPMAYARAKALRLIYPDGTLHAYGKMAVQKLIKDALVGSGK